MSIPDIREQRYCPILRNACLLSLFILCESIQLLLGAIWLLHARPMASEWATRVFPEGLSFVSSERETLFFCLWIVFAASVMVVTIMTFKKILKTNELVVKYGFFFVIEGLLTFLLLSTGFKMLVYAYRPQLAHEAFGILMVLAFLHKFLWWKLKELWESLCKLSVNEYNLPALRQMAHIAVIAFIFLIIYVPNPMAAVARMFFGEQFHHFDLALMASGWAFQSGCRLNVDALSQYGVGMPIVMSMLAKATGGFTYPHVLMTLVWTVIVYYVLYYLLLRAWLGKGLIVLFGIFSVIRLQMFHAGVMPFIMTYPMTTPFRFWYDIVFFWMMFLYVTRQHKIYILLAALACACANFHMVDTGLYLTVTFYAYLFLCLIIPHIRSSFLKHKKDAYWFVTYIVTVPLATLFLFWLVEGRQIWNSQFWLHTFEFAYYFISGMGLEPIAGNIKQGFLFSTAVGLMLPGVYLFTILLVVALCFFQRMKPENLYVVLWSIYGLATFQYYVVHSVESSYYVYVIPFVSVLCYWLKQWADHVSGGLYRKVGVALVLFSMYALVTNHNFLSYPNLLSVSHNPVIDPRVYQIPPGRAFYFHHLYREFPDNFKMPQNSLGEFDEKLVAEADFSSDDQLAEFFKNEFDFSVDAQLIQKFTPQGGKVPLLSSFDVAILMQADRAPFFKYFPILNSRPMRMRIFPVSSIPSQEHLNVTLGQLGEAPPYLFMERIFLDRKNVPAAYYHDSPELMKIVNYIFEHYEPVEAGKFLVAMKFKG